MRSLKDELAFRLYVKPRRQKNTCAIGTVGELKVALDLAEKGYEVFIPLGLGSCDLLVLKKRKVTRVEVKVGSISIDGKVKWAKQSTTALHSDEKYDVVAVCIKDKYTSRLTGAFAKFRKKQIIYIPDVL
jgi:Holliday junction resolvase-like predicted endonuclease